MTALFSMIDLRPPGEARRIDYERMNRKWPGQKRRLAAAVRTGDPQRVAAVCIDAVQVWDEAGAWPDDWSMFQRALDDVLPWNQQVYLQDLAYGPVGVSRS